jgi:hypothetical protein
MATPEEITDIRRKLDTLGPDELSQLSPQDLMALVHALRKALDKAQEVRNTKQVGDDEEWSRLMT